MGTTVLVLPRRGDWVPVVEVVATESTEVWVVTLDNKSLGVETVAGLVIDLGSSGRGEAVVLRIRSPSPPCPRESRCRESNDRGMISLREFDDDNPKPVSLSLSASFIPAPDNLLAFPCPRILVGLPTCP